MYKKYQEEQYFTILGTSKIRPPYERINVIKMLTKFYFRWNHLIEKCKNHSPARLLSNSNKQNDGVAVHVNKTIRKNVF